MSAKNDDVKNFLDSLMGSLSSIFAPAYVVQAREVSNYRHNDTVQLQDLSYKSAIDLIDNEINKLKRAAALGSRDDKPVKQYSLEKEVLTRLRDAISESKKPLQTIEKLENVPLDVKVKVQYEGKMEEKTEKTTMAKILDRCVLTNGFLDKLKNSLPPAQPRHSFSSR